MEILQTVDDALAEGWPLTKKCANCDSTISIQLGDLDYDEWKVSGYHFDGSAKCKWLYTWECPVCKKRGCNGIPEGLIPYSIRERLKDAVRS